MSNKEAERIDAILKKTSEQHRQQMYIFKDVNILTLADSTEIVERDVLVANGIISEIETDIQRDNAIVVDGKNKYLMPGLVDMHIHLFDHHQMKNTWLLLLLINGVTSVRDMAGEPGKLVLRNEISSNEVLGPNLYQAGPVINGIENKMASFEVALSPEQGRKLVIDQKREGYDFIKVYNDLQPEAYWAIIDEAHKQDIRVVGHVPYAVGVEELLGEQYTIEHLTGYKQWRNNIEAYLNTDEDYALKTVKSDTWNCPTLFNLLINWDKEKVEEILADEYVWKYLPNKLKKKWVSVLQRNSKEKNELLAKYGDHNKELFKEIVWNLYKANSKLIIGTDAGSLPLLIPGFSLFEELSALADLGIPIYQVLKMTTINAAIALGKESDFGSVDLGKRADLLLLNNNPLEDINHLKDKNGVMIRGIWLDQKELEKISLEIQEAFGNN